MESIVVPKWFSFVPSRYSRTKLPLASITACMKSSVRPGSSRSTTKNELPSPSSASSSKRRSSDGSSYVVSGFIRCSEDRIGGHCSQLKREDARLRECALPRTEVRRGLRAGRCLRAPRRRTVARFWRRCSIRSLSQWKSAWPSPSTDQLRVTGRPSRRALDLRHARAPTRDSDRRVMRMPSASIGGC